MFTEITLYYIRLKNKLSLHYRRRKKVRDNKTYIPEYIKRFTKVKNKKKKKCYFDNFTYPRSNEINQITLVFRENSNTISLYHPN